MDSVPDTAVKKLFTNEFTPWKKPHYYPKITLSDQGVDLRLLDGDLGRASFGSPMDKPESWWHKAVAWLCSWWWGHAVPI